MSNIAIVNYCNLKCPYCFAEDMIKEENTFMSLDDYNKLLDFILKNPQDRIGILGGEPTLHPNFSDIINITKQKCPVTHITLFSNGIELEKFLPELDGISILINYNNPKNLTKIQQEKLSNTLDKIYSMGRFNIENRCFIGCNIHLNCTNYDYIWDIVDKYSLKLIRCSVVSPGGIYTDWKDKKDKYFNLMKPIYLDFCKQAIIHNCKISMDCSHIPSCYFTDEEMKLVNKACDERKTCYPVCPSVVDFTVDLKATGCFGAYEPIDYNKFSNTKSLSFYLYSKFNKPLAKLNNTGKCATCEQHANGSCQGGCLAFANRPE